MPEIPSRSIGSGAVVVTPTGRLTSVSAPALRDQLRALVEGGQGLVVVDMSDVDFIDSSGLGALISGLKAARQSGGDLRIVAPCAQVTTVLELTNLNQVLKSYDSVDEARDGSR
jgi:anti-sigma B factor antagonist